MSKITAYGYPLLYRPIQLGAQPRGFLVVLGTSRQFKENGSFGRIFYAEPLSEADVKSYELGPVEKVELSPSQVGTSGTVYEWSLSA